jgi:hypothetical protein
VFWGGQTWELTGRGRRLPNPLALTWHSFWRSATWRADAWYHLCNHHVQLSLLFADRLGPYGHLGHKVRDTSYRPYDTYTHCEDATHS